MGVRLIPYSEVDAESQTIAEESLVPQTIEEINPKSHFGDCKKMGVWEVTDAEQNSTKTTQWKRQHLNAISVIATMFPAVSTEAIARAISE